MQSITAIPLVAIILYDSESLIGLPDHTLGIRILSDVLRHMTMPLAEYAIMYVKYELTNSISRELK